MNDIIFKKVMIVVGSRSDWATMANATKVLHEEAEHANFPLVAEQYVPFLYEASIIGVRSLAGEIRYYPATINEHCDGILLRSYTAPNEAIHQQLLPARQLLALLFHHWNYVGVLSLELFVTRNGLVVNELAPRVHNSGHWTMNGSPCSQFENHIRAITGLHPGDTRAKSHAGMVNLLGIERIPDKLERGCYSYWYNKTPTARRKMGHINMLSRNAQRLAKIQNQLIAELYADNLDTVKTA